MNLYKERVLKHGLEWKKHKYLYKDANGNYVYPSDIAKKAGNKARELNAQGQATNVSMRKERAERIKAGNERLYNSKPAQFAKRSFNGTKIGEPINDVVKFAKRQDFSKAFKGNLAKPKSKEEREREIAKTDAELSEALGKIASEMAEDYAKDEAKKKIAQQIYEYDDIGAILADPKYASTKKKKKKKKLITHKTKTTVEHVVSHSDTYRSNAMNLYKREIYKSQLQHGAIGQKWKNHKYLYIDENGNYVYPEDVANGAKQKVSGAGNKVKKLLSDLKPRTETHIDGKIVNTPQEKYDAVYGKPGKKEDRNSIIIKKSENISGKSIKNKAEGYKEVNRRKKAKTIDGRDLIANTKSKEELDTEYQKRDPIGHANKVATESDRRVSKAYQEYADLLKKQGKTEEYNEFYKKHKQYLK